MRKNTVLVFCVAIMMIAGVVESFGQRVRANDSRRTIYSGASAPLDVYGDLPMWVSDAETLNGFSYTPTTAGALGWDKIMVWNEAGNRALPTRLKADAVIYVLNGEANPVDGYLAGCMKNGKPFKNRVRKQEIVAQKISVPTEMICDDGSKPDKDGKCIVRGEMKMICDDGTTPTADGKCLIAGQRTIVCPTDYAYDEGLGKCIIKPPTGDCPEGKLWDFEKKKCVSRGMKTWKVALIAGGAGAGGLILGHYLKNCKHCNDTPIVPIKTTPGTTTGSTGPIRPRIITGFASDGSPIWSYASNDSGSSNDNSTTPANNTPKYGETVKNGVKVKTVIL